jgi:hypothetical protein
LGKISIHGLNPLVIDTTAIKWVNAVILFVLEITNYSPPIDKLQVTSTKNSFQPQKTARTTHLELPEFVFSSLIDTVSMKRRVFINTLLDEFNRNTLLIKKLDTIGASPIS